MNKLTLPSGKTVSLSSPIISQGHFSWGEATKGGNRIPQTLEIEHRIIAIATALEEVRVFLGGYQMVVTSWYRPPAVNKEVGGASDSRHIYGDAVDFKIAQIAPLNCYSRLDNWWGSRGGLGRHQSFTHIDLRGHRARWDY